ncbi:unnamed protein product [Thlaspi arvense]|uniref:Ubiquitin-like protease family profile domain-containing protein n=1 Tax=Thlaspi arvense TaxID=13288 RepID=A0AAU9T5J5_THLAR|nr:unnamed protein product [Thlaspi arvense]
MANEATKRKRNRGVGSLSTSQQIILPGKSRFFSEKPVSSSNATISRLSRYPVTKFREFHANRRGFLRFRSLVRRSKKKAKPRDCCGNVEISRETTRNLFGHKYDSNKPILKFNEKEKIVIDLIDDEDSSIEDDNQILVEERSSTWGFRNGENRNNLSVSLLRRSPRLKKTRVEVSHEPFLPLKKEEVAQVNAAFSVRNRNKVLALHKNSNIDIHGETLQCLKPFAWLNDEVINVYLELLKERETRDPQKYLKCHFFNTFFYIKLVSASGYNYEAVRRWTTQRKLGYNLIDCDIIFVPIHGGVHWTLAVINKRECKFLYLDSLNGYDPRILNVLAKYIVDEVKDKSGKVIDVSSWDIEFVKDLPRQQNGYDCGMFMLKYIDFYSRGLALHFSQKEMPYFRLRTANEILRLRAD